jgi:hypothetical protein
LLAWGEILSLPSAAAAQEARVTIGAIGAIAVTIAIGAIGAIGATIQSLTSHPAGAL